MGSFLPKKAAAPSDRRVFVWLLPAGIEAEV